jgi:GTPase SAR1 family protein
MDTKSEYNEDYSQSFSQTKQKIVLIGDICVGKTSIINSILESKFKDSYEVRK